ncbi:dihydropteroate synthase [Oenococcus sp. UCMA 17063]|nr:dihydropteroate synthase [Oenococcus sp. UCMA 17063]
MEINEITNTISSQTSYFGKLITLEFTDSEKEILKLRPLIDKFVTVFWLNGNRAVALVNKEQLKNLILNWPITFKRNKKQLQKILDDQRVFFKGQNFSFDITFRPLIYSILNITPDSFYDGGINTSVVSVLKRIEKEKVQGADIFELGGKSSRPNFKDITASQEWERIAPYIKAIKKQFPELVLAIDSNTEQVIEKALDQGVDIINDIDGFNSKKKLELVRNYHPSVVTMYNGRNFSEKADNLSIQLTEFFKRSVQNLKDCGLNQQNIVLDPGVGFSKAKKILQLDLCKMQAVSTLAFSGSPIMIAISRKSFLEKLFQLELKDRLLPTLLFENNMLESGGRILRVHDVKETKEMIDIYQIYHNNMELP